MLAVMVILIVLSPILFGLGLTGVENLLDHMDRKRVVKTLPAPNPENLQDDPASCRYFIERLTQHKLLEAGIIEEIAMMVCEREDCPECAGTQRAIAKAEREELQANCDHDWSTIYDDYGGTYSKCFSCGKTKTEKSMSTYSSLRQYQSYEIHNYHWSCKCSRCRNLKYEGWM